MPTNAWQSSARVTMLKRRGGRVEGLGKKSRLLHINKVP